MICKKQMLHIPFEYAEKVQEKITKCRKQYMRLRLEVLKTREFNTLDSHNIILGEPLIAQAYDDVFHTLKYHKRLYEDMWLRRPCLELCNINISENENKTRFTISGLDSRIPELNLDVQNLSEYGDIFITGVILRPKKGCFIAEKQG